VEGVKPAVFGPAFDDSSELPGRSVSHDLPEEGETLLAFSIISAVED
jgi:hypothetical protein